MKKAFILIIALLGAMLCATAAPLKNMEVRLTQPDGQVINCFASGDEFYNYLHDANGFTIVKGDDGFYCYAIHNEQGQVVASTYRVGSVDPASVGLQPNVKISEAEYHRLRQEREQYIRPVQRPRDRELNHGRYNNLVVFIRFAGDTYHSTSYATVDSMFNAANYESISLHNYYHHISYNQLDLRSFFYPEPDGQTLLSYEDIHPKQYYQPYDASTNPIGYQDANLAEREFSLLEGAINYINGMVPDTLDLDYNGDGMVDNVVFVIKGETGEWNSLLWPHRWCIYDRYVWLNGLRVYDFNLQLEQGGYFNVSTLCHEMFHSLGAPDLYHYSGGVDAVGQWDVMCSDTEPPQQPGVYMKYKYGHWVDDIPDITGDYGYYEIEADSWEGNRRNAYRIGTSDPNQFIVVEYRNQNDVFDSHVPDGGLIIYRIDTRFDGNAGWNGTDQFDEIYVFRPGGSVNEAGDLGRANFCAERNRTEFSIYTDPYLFLTNGQSFDWSERIYNIGTRGNKISFTYGPLNGDGEAPGPNNFIAHVNSLEHQVELSWEAGENIDSYKVFRDGQEIASGLTETTFVHPYSNDDNGYHTYSVVSVAGGVMNVLSAPSDQWVIIGNYETIRVSITSDSPYGTKGGELEITNNHPQMPTQRLTIYEGTQNETQLYVAANTMVTFNWNPGFDPDSEGIHITATRLNENGESTLFDLDRPEAGLIATYIAVNESLGVIPPQNLTAVSNGAEIQLRWTVPTENKTFDIYRDGSLRHTVEGGYTYLDNKIMRSGTHNYHVESTIGDITSWNPDNLVYGTSMNYYCEPPQNLQGTYNDGHVELNWDAPAFVGHGMMAYDNNVFLDQMGGNNHKWGIRIEPTHLALFEGHPLTHVELFDCSSGTYTFTIYNGELANNSSQIYVQQHVMEGTHEWVKIDLDEAVNYDATLPLWVCVGTSGAQSPIPCCDYVGVDNSCLIKSGSQWKPVTEFGTYRSWMLRAYTSPIEDQGIKYNVYWGPEEGGENQMVLGYEAITTNQASYNTTENQRYHITALWDNRETEASNTVYLGPSVGIDEDNTEAFGYEVYPNPVSQRLTIKAKGLRHISLITLTGVKVYDRPIKGDAAVMDLGSLSKGLYLLNLLTDEGIRTVKVMKQ